MALTADPSGVGNPPGTYTVIDQYPNILVTASGNVVDAQTIVASDDIYRVEFTFTISRQEYMGSGPQAAAGLRASWLQTLAGHDHVQDLWVAQDLNKRQLLTDMVFVTVGGEPAVGTVELEFPLASANTRGAFQAIDDAYKQLLAVSQSS